MLLTLGWLAPGAARPAFAAPTTYYLHCTAGDDSQSGTSPALAWRTLGKANGANLQPGDKLLLARGCTWTGTLRATWNGTPAAKITIGAYGSGALPVIKNTAADLLDGAYNAVDLTGSHLIVEYLEVTLTDPPVSAACANNPLGFFIGFNFRNPANLADGGSFNLLRYSKASRMTAGAHFNNNTHDNQILRSQFVDNNAMSILTPVAVNANDDLGAWGVLLKGRNQEVAYNYFANNRAWCTFDTLAQGNAVEVYEAQSSRIHHNTSLNDRVFSELGGSAGYRVDDITIAYNLVVSSALDARFVVARGAGNPFGPTTGTAVYNNTVYFTGAQSQGIVCGAGCSPAVLTARNNLLWAEAKAIYGDAPFTEDHNLYWSTNGQPVVQLQGTTMSPTSKVANPKFLAPGGQDFRVQAGSPAINGGQYVGWAMDLLNTVVPQGGLPDIGSYEYFVFSGSLDHALHLPLIQVGP